MPVCPRCGNSGWLVGDGDPIFDVAGLKCDCPAGKAIDGESPAEVPGTTTSMTHRESGMPTTKYCTVG
jgi:hypothetical protein